jgi:SAM-dependent methyltransferase
VSGVRERASEVGGRSLEVFADTPRLNRWIVSKLVAGVRGDVLEIGSGIGNISRLIRPHCDSLVVTDTEAQYLEALRRLFAGDAGVTAAAFDLDFEPPPAIVARRYDAIVAVNVMEHIADDQALCARLAGLLKPGGHLLIYVPASPVAYGTLDEALGHHRRYTLATLTALLRGASLDPGQPRYVNLLGLAGWYVAGRLLRQRLLSPWAVALFERLVPLLSLEDRVALPVGLGLCTLATKRG